MKISIYELLGMIKDDKAPKKIKYDDRIWVKNSNNNDYTDTFGNEFFDSYLILAIIDDIVEILDKIEEKKIPGKLNLYYHINNDVEEETGETTFNDLCDIIGNLRKHEDTINSIIDYLESKEKGE